ncbi:lipopolysaccharide biosynthesis protein [Streptomyces polyrhachis]|uniref:Lipopolysaccharide biosynthesis protein n=1 Tax=Streptomyces polyrhachis TaxID=1282885 RepID=A0ABW2GES5_9ACTN
MASGHAGRHRQLRSGPDQVFVSSFFLLASTVVTAGLSFLFWVVVARYYSPEQVGLATSLISATTLLAFLSLAGLNSTLIRFPAPEPSRDAQITQSMLLVAVLACAAAGVYLLGLPLYGQKLLFIREDPAWIAAFVLFCACAAVNLLMKSVFIAARTPQFNVLSDGLLQGAAKLALPAALTGLGTAGILGSAGGGFVVAVVSMLLLMRAKLGFRLDFLGRGTRLREQLRFSVASHVSSVVNLAPVMALPLIVLHYLGAAQAGYYFIAFQIASLLNAVSAAVGEAIFAEVSADPSRFGEMMRRSAKIIAVVQVPAVTAVALGGGLLLKVFGGSYADSARDLLCVLALSALAVALNTWACFALKLLRRMKRLILSNLVLAAVSVGLAVLWTPRGLLWVGLAWGAGNLAAGCLASLSLLGSRPSPAAAAPAAPSGPTGHTGPVVPAPAGDGDWLARRLAEDDPTLQLGPWDLGPLRDVYHGAAAPRPREPWKPPTWAAHHYDERPKRRRR